VGSCLGQSALVSKGIVTVVEKLVQLLRPTDLREPSPQPQQAISDRKAQGNAALWPRFAGLRFSIAAGLSLFRPELQRDADAGAPLLQLRYSSPAMDTKERG
jgi:hypothetical protein